jgi:hypothetical protein
MDAFTLDPAAPLPDEVPTLQALLRTVLAELARVRAENAELRGKLEAALKHRFGRRSERRPQRTDAAGPRSAAATRTAAARYPNTSNAARSCMI